MSSTRTAKDKSVFHQSRYASSAEFERGLLANLVAKRCALLDDKSERELIWFVQYLSHQAGGLAALAKDLIQNNPDALQTIGMVQSKLKRGKICGPEQVRQLRPDFLGRETSFLLNGEIDDPFCGIRKVYSLTDEEKRLYSNRECWGRNPEKYPSNAFFDLCSNTASSELESYFKKICLDPAASLKDGPPWYFPTLAAALRQYQIKFLKDNSAGLFVTTLGAKVCEVLDYTFYSRGLTLMEGNARLGKSFAAKAWCLQNPGRARFVEVPPGNDEASFFRALARGLGLGNFLNYKVGEIKERVESVLLSGDLLLVLDEAQRLWPQRNLRYGNPHRIVWLMALVNQDIPVCCIATPQFIELQKAAEEKGQWNSAQLTGRISHFESLPTVLEEADLMGVAKSILPEADGRVLKALAVYARSSARYLAAIDSISKRSRFLALRDGRIDATTADVCKAMQESVIPADTKLFRALSAHSKPKRNGQAAALLSPVIQDGPSSDSRRPDDIAPGNPSRANLDAFKTHPRTEFEAPLLEA